MMDMNAVWMAAFTMALQRAEPGIVLIQEISEPGEVPIANEIAGAVKDLLPERFLTFSPL